MRLCSESITAMILDRPSERIRQMFGQIARRYDFLNHLLSLGRDRRWRRKMVKLVPPTDDGPILDVCCGTADLALAYHRVNRDKVPIVGVDFCHPMLQRAKKKCRRKKAGKQITLIEADARQLPFLDDTFQIVCVAFGLRNVNNPSDGLREMVRVCRPGGRVAVLEFSMPTMWPFRTVYKFYFHHILPRVGQILARNRFKAYCYLPASVGRFPQDEAMVQRMRHTGLRKVKYRRFTFGIVSLYTGEK